MKKANGTAEKPVTPTVWKEWRYGSGSSLSLAKGLITASVSWSSVREESGYKAQIGIYHYKMVFQSFDEGQQFVERRIAALLERAGNELEELGKARIR